MKNIILLSDGTGNGAAKRQRTNVWRLYSALDLHRPDQIAYYDDGVGSQEFLPFKLLGGVFGWGLKRNVLELYTFLCRNYQADDKIYLFGFSRGAFTVRVLAGLVAYCGLVSGCTDEQELNARARQNYSAYRSRYQRGYLSKLFGALGRAVGALFGGKAPCDQGRTRNPDIEFIGVWDTVDAYGLPIDELAILWDRFIYPMRFPDAQLSTKVKRACHALSIDDERLTFHPLLWDEDVEKGLVREKKVTAGRIEQVWFAGVHSDVGGGYPMSDLALVPLDWMISRVESASPTAAGLHFIAEMRNQFLCHSDWHGKQHDSRSGLAAYYRYKPRNIAHLSDDPLTGVRIETPKIHRAVMERIKGNSVSYAPTGLPPEYEVLATRGSVPVYENAPSEKTQRAEALNAALDVIYWRRWLYAALVGTTVVLLATRFFLDWETGGICKGVACAVDPLLQLAIDVLPDFAAGWFEALRQNPQWLAGLVLALVVFLWLKQIAWRNTQQKATAAWAALKGYGTPPAWKPTLTSRLRNAAYSKLRTMMRWTAAGGVLLVILYLLIAIVGHVSLYVRSSFGLLCQDTGANELRAPRSVTFDISDPCFGTGILLRKGQRYRFEVQAADWFDGSYAGGPDGLDDPSLFAHTLWVPLRRAIAEPWFKLMGRIDNSGNERLVIGTGLDEYRARSNGELFLYVNDAVFGFLPNWAWPYSWNIGGNVGQATVTVSPANNE